MIEREQLGGAGITRQLGAPGSGMFPVTHMLGFDVDVSKFYGTPGTLQPVFVNVYTVPDNVTRAVITELAVTGWPYGFWLTRSSWTARVQGAGAQEYQTGSTLADTPNNVLVSGMRWSPMGSLARPLPVRIQLKPATTFQIGIIHQTGATFAVSVYIRGRGVVYTP